jgi:hypothetical protein
VSPPSPDIIRIIPAGCQCGEEVKGGGIETGYELEELVVSVWNLEMESWSWV